MLEIHSRKFSGNENEKEIFGENFEIRGAIKWKWIVQGMLIKVLNGASSEIMGLLSVLDCVGNLAHFAVWFWWGIRQKKIKIAVWIEFQPHIL